MSTAIAHTFQGHDVRHTPDPSGEPVFIGRDVCSVVGISKYRDALAQLDEDERVSVVVDTPGGPQSMTGVTEAGVWSLMMISRSPIVKPFKRWLTHEVLPAIRKSGGYSLVPKSLPEALRAYATEVEAHEATRAELEQAAPAAAAWDALADADGDYSLRDAAQILSRDPSIRTGQNRLMVSIRELRMVDSSGQPYQKHIEHLRLRVTSYEHPHSGEPVLSKQVRITVHGLKYLHKRLGGTQPLRLDTTAPVAAGK